MGQEQSEHDDKDHACCHHDHKHNENTNSMSRPGDENVIYTCPMHPEVRQQGPGNCPICGMGLEPETITGEEAENPELIDMRKRFWVGLVLTLPVFTLEMGSHIFNLHHFISSTVSNWTQLVLATPVVLWAGKPFLARLGFTENP